MAIKSIDRIITAKDYGGSMRGYLKKCQRDFYRLKNISVIIKDLDKEPTGNPVKPRIWQSQWIADCDVCNTAMFVDPDEPIFFCFGCGNRLNGNRPRPVDFPPEAERKEIERLLLERPMIDVGGLTDMERVALQRHALNKEVEEIDILEFRRNMVDGKNTKDLPTKIRLEPLVRSWEGESVEQLRKEQEPAIEKWRKELKRGV